MNVKIRRGGGLEFVEVSGGVCEVRHWACPAPGRRGKPPGICTAEPVSAS
jgi:hypothetical protein